jgi:hypothetical protein
MTTSFGRVEDVEAWVLLVKHRSGRSLHVTGKRALVRDCWLLEAVQASQPMFRSCVLATLCIEHLSAAPCIRRNLLRHLLVTFQVLN